MEKPPALNLTNHSRREASRTIRSRFQPQPRTGLRLEPRDEELLCDLFLHRAMSRGQIQALYFSSTVRCNVRLRLLFDHGYVSRYYLPFAPFGAQAVYSIGKAAVPLVAARLDMDVAEVGQQYRRAKTPQFLAHTLEIVNLRLAFRNAVAQREDVEIERWLPEIQCRHEFEIRQVDGSWRKEIFKPDAFVRLAKHGWGSYQNYFLEVDLGHTSSRQFLGKLHAHRRYLESGLFQETFGCDGFQTLVVTTGAGRLNNLCSLVESSRSDLFWFSTYEQVKEAGVLGAIWQVPFADSLRTLT
jgi:hypothetical protein